MNFVIFISITILLFSKTHSKDIECEWTSLTGVKFDLKPLRVPEGKVSYLIKDGDIPCTPDTEPTYSFLWNLCADVTQISYPSICGTSKRGSAMQYLIRSDNYTECEVIGHYDPRNDDSHYNLLDSSNPALGVSITYRAGDKCPNGVLRTSTIDILCENVDSLIVSALEPTKCGYHMVMKSYHGCPTTCPTNSGGLCSSHGHCYYDKVNRASYCYCNEGYYGDDCSLKGEFQSESYDGYSVQVGLLCVLLVVTIGLTGVVGLMVYKISEYRKENADSNPLPSASTRGFMSTEMVGVEGDRF